MVIRRLPPDVLRRLVPAEVFLAYDVQQTSEFIDGFLPDEYTGVFGTAGFNGAALAKITKFKDLDYARSLNNVPSGLIFRVYCILQDILHVENFPGSSNIHRGEFSGFCACDFAHVWIDGIMSLTHAIERLLQPAIYNSTESNVYQQLTESKAHHLI